MRISVKEYKHKRWTLIVIYLYLILILLSLLTVASYTWFSLSSTPRVSNLNMYINSDSGMQIALSWEPEAEWGNRLDFRDMVDVTTPLRPVTWSDKNQQFFAAEYGFDGRLTGNWEPLTDERHANKDNADGYYVKATFFARTGTPCDVSLSPAVEVDEGISGSGTYLIGTPVWDAENILHNNGGQGAETAVRIGIRITPIDPETGEPTGEADRFFIYEPNSDLHIDGSTGYVNTPSLDQTDHLVREEFLIRQTASTWTEAYPVQREVVVRSLGEFTDPTDLFKLDPTQMVRVDLYVWLEGQDVDCTNRISAAQILASIQLLAETDTQSGLQPIE